MIKLIVFDMDGVLVGGCEWHRIALNAALKEVSNYEISLREHYATFNGIPTKVKLKKLADGGFIKISDMQKIEDLKQEKTIEIIEKYSFLRQEKVDLMHFLKNKNIKLACYTNSIKKTAELMLKKAGILDSLDILVTNQDVANPKPDPEGYRLCLKYFNLQPDNAIIIEDSPKGLEAAHRSGCRVIKVKDQESVNINLFKDLI